MNDKQTTVIVDVLGHNEPVAVDPQQPIIYGDDLAAVRGDGVFETFMLRGGVVRNQQRHAQRFQRSATMLDLPEPDLARWQEATALAVREYRQLVAAGSDGDGGSAGDCGGDGEAALRWVYSRGRESTGQPTGWVTVAPVGDEVLRARKDGVAVMTAERGFKIDLSQRSPWALIGAKTLSYAANMAALRSAKKSGFDDVIFVSEEGLVLEGPTSTVVVLQGNTLVTPPASVGILAGTSQAALFSLAREKGWETQEKVLELQDLMSADGVWLLSSVRVAARVTSIDWTQIPRPECAEEIEAMAWEAVTGQG
ncbi:MAG TPA: aminodeoxychorismate lyase [Candidatus Corynebacterium gallistercoris]|uniref:Aminodeoxychorismate lyase n=1 Tax=Candidatus Corynebacterium gallistercoris TaxID=2838530 RepID=A0A9D1RYP5_9CORY|nr:aminodeoxychorismate lyase [Candidatus Corynebacterium gallistercoris]